MKIGVLRNGQYRADDRGEAVQLGHDVLVGSRTAKEDAVTFADAATHGELVFYCTAGDKSLGRYTWPRPTTSQARSSWTLRAHSTSRGGCHRSLPSATRITWARRSTSLPTVEGREGAEHRQLQRDGQPLPAAGRARRVRLRQRRRRQDRGSSRNIQTLGGRPSGSKNPRAYHCGCGTEMCPALDPLRRRRARTSAHPKSSASATALLAWYGEHARDLNDEDPRDHARSSMSEVMLQQTRGRPRRPPLRGLADALADSRGPRGRVYRGRHSRRLRLGYNRRALSTTKAAGATRRVGKSPELLPRSAAPRGRWSLALPNLDLSRSAGDAGQQPAAGLGPVAHALWIWHGDHPGLSARAACRCSAASSGRGHASEAGSQLRDRSAATVMTCVSRAEGRSRCLLM